jgi:hypothetical protein
MRESNFIGLHAMSEHIERRKTRATTISHARRAAKQIEKMYAA